ncbi:hypothetical protein [Streptomyces orinoci]|uniref:Uncharacterized protein n=1 Tax=Streptomyces orinoci TaxID=67339 RepID=A0ABV3K755_STRON|nr:hypothetical protein [Streptomyces orinoci]
MKRRFALPAVAATAALVVGTLLTTGTPALAEQQPTRVHFTANQVNSGPDRVHFSTPDRVHF